MKSFHLLFDDFSDKLFDYRNKFVPAMLVALVASFVVPLFRMDWLSYPLYGVSILCLVLYILCLVLYYTSTKRLR